MFSLEQIKTAHSKVKSGADFPAYIQAIQKLGVTYYESFVSDGHTDYYGEGDYSMHSPAKYDLLDIALECDIDLFKAGLKSHQQGETDYPSFITMCAKHGVEKWVVCLEKMVCTYYDRGSNEILVEEIPQ